MLISLHSNNDKFKKIFFKKGFNVILAEREATSTSKDTRNGTGKSSIIEIINFCLGGDPSTTLLKKEVEKYTFTLELSVENKVFKITRGLEDKSKAIIEGDYSDWAIKPDEKNGVAIISISKLNKVLGNKFFNLEIDYQNYKYAPSFRSCFSYYARQNGESGGYLSPFTHYRNQLEWDIQVHNSILLGLDWKLACNWQLLKDRKKILNQMKDETNFSAIFAQGSLGSLEAKRVRLESNIKMQHEQLDNFSVHPQYHEIEREVNDETHRIHNLVNENITDANLLDHYLKNLKEELDANIDSITNMYTELGIVLPSIVKQRIEDVQHFHKNIVVNRKDFLNAETTRLKNKILERNNKIQDLSEQRRTSMNILKQHKALEEYTNLQKRFSEMTVELENVKNQISIIQKFKNGESSYKIDIELLQQQARISIDERKEIKDKAIEFFNLNSQAMYNSPGTLSIDVKPTGYKFSVDIKREGSHAIGNMKVFCYDLMRAQMMKDHDFKLDFLIHDSIIFADVDERQIAQALQIAERESNNKEFQYICTMNSDNVPYKDIETGFDINKFVILTLNDSSEEGGLFGFRF